MMKQWVWARPTVKQTIWIIVDDVNIEYIIIIFPRHGGVQKLLSLASTDFNAESYVTKLLENYFDAGKPRSWKTPGQSIFI